MSDLNAMQTTGKAIATGCSLENLPLPLYQIELKGGVPLDWDTRYTKVYTDSEGDLQVEIEASVEDVLPCFEDEEIIEYLETNGYTGEEE